MLRENYWYGYRLSPQPDSLPKEGTPHFQDLTDKSNLDRPVSSSPLSLFSLHFRRERCREYRLFYRRKRCPFNSRSDTGILQVQPSTPLRRDGCFPGVRPHGTSIVLTSKPSVSWLTVSMSMSMMWKMETRLMSAGRDVQYTKRRALGYPPVTPALSCGLPTAEVCWFGNIKQCNLEWLHARVF